MDNWQFELRDRFFWHRAQRSGLFYVLKNVYISPNEAFVKGSFSLAAIDLFDGCCFYFAVGVENVDDVAADDGDRFASNN